MFVVLTGFTGLVLATIIRLELAYPGQVFLAQNAERYLTTISLHGIVMVFFVVIPVLFGAFGNFLLPTQLGIRDVAFPRLNSFMFWITPGGFILLLHTLLFDRAYELTHWVNYSELRQQLRRRYVQAQAEQTEVHVFQVLPTSLSLRLQLTGAGYELTRGMLTKQQTPRGVGFTSLGVDFTQWLHQTQLGLVTQIQGPRNTLSLAGDSLA